MPSQLHHAEQSNGASKIFHPGQLSVVEIIAYLSLSLLACCSIRAVYLLYFHPLASFRGPKKQHYLHCGYSPWLRLANHNKSSSSYIKITV
ncbi:hypothetical protein HBH56_129080 [Parastagonospora nodorum]|nr:hypothetical protein HBH56_129080 [Parastagonospora nodorum]KAH3971806.1 hypothetical protein HBH52_158050 [Parastagonospora nodorum]KAH3996592.1 hypothetical protein HBI10_157150 [Parastagonospora nodorum]KAH4135167.1 hypothetical protein HBH45_154630 [Parastagonospora nodorum]KAH4637652.1 hypothetical protein HBH81_108150 [Parastagonospora nodorum]